jgi:cytochrome c-type biogenesis protein CcmE
MAQAAWEKPSASAGLTLPARHGFLTGRMKYMIGGVVILGAILFLVVSATMGGARFFITVEETVSNPAYIGQSVRVTGVVIGDTIRYDAANLLIEFEVAHVPSNVADAGAALHQAANDPTATRMLVRVENQVKPDLLQHEAQAIMTGMLGEDGVFHVSELNLKCPSRFIEGSAPQLNAPSAGS